MAIGCVVGFSVATVVATALVVWKLVPIKR